MPNYIRGVHSTKDTNTKNAAGFVMDVSWVELVTTSSRDADLPGLVNGAVEFVAADVTVPLLGYRYVGKYSVRWRGSA